MPRSSANPRTSVAVLAAAALVLLTACAHHAKRPGPVASLPGNAPPAVQQAFLQGTPVPAALVDANNGMGLSLFNQLSEAAPGANLVLAPTSLAQCLEMIYNGAAGGTATAMGQAMALGSLTATQVDLDNAALLASLYTADPGATLLLANGVWAASDILPAFLAANQTYFGATVGPMAGVPGTVNAWVQQATQGTIPSLLDPARDYRLDRAILVDAIYFKGSWATAFTPAQTAPAPFTRLDGSQVTCAMMNQTMKAGYTQTALATAARLPYGDGRYGMILVLPQPGVTLQALGASLNGTGWQTLVQGFMEEDVNVKLPKFTATWFADLKAPLTQLGMGVAFDPLRADFSAMATEPVHLDFLYQATTVAVDELGTVASAATAGGMSSGAVLPVFFTLDQPFLYAIQDAQTGTILFLGQMTDPTASQG